MGYVGVVSGACLADSGHEVVGVDVSRQKVDLINSGASPIVEEGISELVENAVATGGLRAITDVAAAIETTDISFVSVGTPSAPNGSLSTEYVERVSTQIGQAIKRKQGSHSIVYRSTVLPGTTDDLLIPILVAESGRQLGDGLEVCFNPEFLREGSSIKDFHNPPMTVIGTDSEAMCRTMEDVYAGVAAPVFRTGIRIAESVKYMSNIFHAVKITFANEMGVLLKESGIDAREVAEIFCQDTVLNVSKAYLRPGFAFGGSCLPKDLRAFLSLARRSNVDLPMLSNVMDSNDMQVEQAFKMVAARGSREVALFGLSFKAGTDDLRESPLVALAERLIGKGYNLKIYDANVRTARLMGANKQYIEREIPHFEKLLQPTPEAALDGAGVVVIGHADGLVIDAIMGMASPCPIVDLQGVGEIEHAHRDHYHGVCW